MVTITVLIDLPPRHAYHVATLAALDHAAVAMGIERRITVVRTDQVDAAVLGGAGRLHAGVVIGPGTPYIRPEAAHEVIRLARERGIPLVAT